MSYYLLEPGIAADRKYWMVSVNSQGIDDPADLSVFISLAVVVANEKLIGEYPRHYLRLIILEASMPSSIFQLEQRLESLVEWLHHLSAPRI